MNLLVEGINRAADAWWAYMAPAAWQAALVGLLLLAVVAIGRRWPSPVRFAILALALAKFAVPPLAAIPIGLFSQFSAESPHQADAVAETPVEPSIDLTAESPITVPRIVNAGDLRMASPPGIEYRAPPPAPLEAAARRASTPERACPALSATAWLMLAHLAGVLTMFAAVAVQYRRVLRIVRAGEQVTDGPLYQQYVSLCQTLGLRRQPRLMLAAAGTQPFSCGTFRASVVLPEPLVHRLSLDQLRATLAHELAHHRRCDLWLNWLQVLLCAVWWFHPVVWLLNRAMRAAREDCCDDLLLAKSLVDDDAYCGTLLRVAAVPMRASRSPLSLTMSDSPHSLGRRFRRIMDSTLRRWPKLPLSALAVLIVLAAVLLPGLRRATVAADADLGQTERIVTDTSAEPSSSTAASESKKRADSRPTAADGAPLLTVFGRVVDSDGKPVAGATVYLREWSTYRVSSEPYNRNLNDILATTKTDAAGTLRFENVPSKKLHEQWVSQNPWDVVVVARPYAVAWRHLSAPRDTRPLEIKLAAGATIRGRITDPQGRPVANAKATVLGISALGSDWHPPFDDPETLDLQLSRLCPTAKSDAEGQVIIDGLPRDALLGVEIRHPDLHRQFVHVATTDGPQADMEIPEHAKGNRIVSPKVFSVTFSAKLDPPAPRIVGRLVAADSKRPLAGARVDELQALGTLTDEAGRFTFEEVDRLPCRLLAFSPKGTDYLSRFVNVALAKDTRDTAVEIELSRGEILSGTVADAKTGKGVADVNVRFDTGFDINTAKVDGVFCSGGVTDGKGRFGLAVPAGKGKLNISGPVEGYDLPGRTYTPPGQQEDDDPDFVKTVEVVAGKRTAEVTFSVSRGDAPAVKGSSYPVARRGTRIVQGTVVDSKDKPVPDAEVGTWQSFYRGEKLFPTDEHGRFAFRVSTYQISEAIVAVQRERQLFGHASLDDAARDVKTSMVLRLLPTGTVTGRVMEGDKPLAGIAVQLIAEREPGAPQRVGYCSHAVRTDNEGAFRIPLVEADKEFSVHLFSEAYTNPEMRCDRVRVSAGGTFEVRPFSLVHLDKSVAGIVVDPDGKPVAGAMVSAGLRSGGSIPRAFLRHPTGSNGEFVIRGVPNLPLTLTAYMQATANPRGGRIHFPARVDAEPGRTDVQILLDPKLVLKKK
jgi:beta-lactamase regulating signal transducer with metallopeptidase domain/protocatechuate 3,4-dioxygenase beta subunit